MQPGSIEPQNRNINRKRKIIMEMSENFTTRPSNLGGVVFLTWILILITS